jgi:hypothetical protein
MRPHALTLFHSAGTTHAIRLHAEAPVAPGRSRPLHMGLATI